MKMSRLVVDIPKKLFRELEQRAKGSSFSKSWHVNEALKEYLKDDFDVRDAIEGPWKDA
jgi:metal-responsive CopG/Arc/MetJ family transcriptional regulator